MARIPEAELARLKSRPAAKVTQVFAELPRVRRDRPIHDAVDDLRGDR